MKEQNKEFEQSEIERLDKIIEQNMKFLCSIPNFRGVGIGYKEVNSKLTKELAICISVIKKIESSKLGDTEQIPKILEGAFGETAVTDVIETGEIVPQSGYRSRIRPVSGAYSIGSVDEISAGTGGGFCIDANTGDHVLLTNNHVVNAGDPENGPADKRIVQPGRYDGGNVTHDVIGHIKGFFPLITIPRDEPHIAPINAIDAATVSLKVSTTPNMPAESAQMIYNVGDPMIGETVRKQGRTTGFTIGANIRHVRWRQYLNYGSKTDPKWCWIGPNAFSYYYSTPDYFNAAGDSGSLIYYLIDAEPPIRPMIIGLHFAGGQGWGYACNIRTVGEKMNLRPFAKKEGTQLLLKTVYVTYSQQKKLKPSTLSPTAMKHAEIVLHQFHDKYMMNPTGRKIFDVLNANYDGLVSAFVSNPIVSKLITENMGSFFFAKNLKVLEEMNIDLKTASNMQLLFSELEKTDNSLEELCTFYGNLFRKMKGKKVAEFFGDK